ncbi:hypothetical protein B296_00022373 [Ensete ventricosum]|uniref:Uncharacterized protein n=1 Tax=Ensete ventricosum TaxID=4639 RepID=A0A427A794_ENSVE|nr:hypothetical protein B296_00022373 [Ensete ventricosum]
MTSISFVQLQEGYLNQDAKSMRAISQPKAYKPLAPINYKNLDEELTKIRKTSTIQEYQLNQLWFLMQCSLISGYFHDFTEERTMMLKVFPDNDLKSKAHDCKNE